MANPRKFSEKIALLSQKEAEGNAAYEAIIKEVNATTRAVHQQKVQKQATTTHFFLTQPQIGTYRGGSLPNVNQMSNNSVDLQSALDSLQTMKQGSGRQSLLMQRLQKERGRQLQSVKRPPPFDKRMEISPYNPAYLSPPPDSSWRRVNSDSAIHSNAMGPTVSIFPVNDINVAQKVVELVPLQNSVTLDANQLWELKREELRPRSCDVPGINIFPSPEPDNGGINIPIPSNSGSLPDLTSVQFPVPLATPIDTDEQSWSQLAAAANASGVQDVLSQAILQQQHDHIGAVRANSPSSRRRHPQGSPSPLVINGSIVQMRQGALPQMNSSNIGMLDASANHAPNTNSLHPHSAANINAQRVHHMYNGTQSSGHQHAAPGTGGLSTSPRRFDDHRWSAGTSPVRMRNSRLASGAAGMQYRSSQSAADGPQSPTSPLSQPSYSPADSPGLSAAAAQQLSSQLSLEALQLYQLQQQQQHQQMQTSELQQQFELINMSSRLVGGGGVSQPQFVHHGNSIAGLTQQQQQQLIGSTQQYNNVMSLGDVTTLSDAELIALATNFNFVSNGNDGRSLADNSFGTNIVPTALIQQQQPQLHLNAQTSLQGLSVNDQLSLLAAQQQRQLQQQQQQQQQMSAASMHVPDIILTGADGSAGRPDLTRDLGNVQLPDIFYDLFNGDDAIKVSLDPLDLDSLQMLTDPSLVTDTETEDSFRLDRL